MSNEGDGEDRHKSIHGAETDLMQEMRHCALDHASVILRDGSQSLDSVKKADSMLILCDFLC